STLVLGEPGQRAVMMDLIARGLVVAGDGDVGHGCSFASLSNLRAAGAVRAGRSDAAAEVPTERAGVGARGYAGGMAHIPGDPFFDGPAFDDPWEDAPPPEDLDWEPPADGFEPPLDWGAGVPAVTVPVER